MDIAFASLTPAQRILFLPLYLRGLDYRADDPILGDGVSAELVETIDYDFTPIRGGAVMAAVHAARTRTLDDIVRGFVRRHPDAVVLDLGCGLDPRSNRCEPPPGVAWFDVDLPEVIRLRERFLPDRSTLVAADLARPDPDATGEVATDWLDVIPADRPTLIVNDGLMIPLTGPAFEALARALTAHFGVGEYAFSAYHPIALRRPVMATVVGADAFPAAGTGFIDPREPERWAAGLTLQQELLIARSPSVAKFPQPWRTFARLTSRATRFHRTGDRIVHYRFGAGD